MTSRVLILERAAGAEVGGSSIETSKTVGMDLAVSPRWLRHAHASHALERRAPIQLVQATFATPPSQSMPVVISTLARRLVFLPIRAHPVALAQFGRLAGILWICEKGEVSDGSVWSSR